MIKRHFITGKLIVDEKTRKELEIMKIIKAMKPGEGWVGTLKGRKAGKGPDIGKIMNSK